MIAFFVVLGFLHGQVSKINGKVVDANSQPLYLALVYNADLGIGAYTDENGYFEIITQKQPSELEVFALGYFSENIHIADDSVFFRVKMERLVYDLDELTVTPCDDNVEAWGVELESSISSNLNSPIKFSSQVGLSLMVPPDHQIMEIEVMAINRSFKRGNFRVRIYSLNRLGMPSKDLLQQNLIVRLPRFRSRRPLRIDLRDYNVFTSTYGILVAVERLSFEENLYQLHHSPEAMAFYAPAIGLTAIDDDQELQMLSKKDGGEWGRSTIPVYRNENQRQVPYIRVYLSACP